MSEQSWSKINESCFNKCTMFKGMGTLIAVTVTCLALWYTFSPNTLLQNTFLTNKSRSESTITSPDIEHDHQHVFMSAYVNRRLRYNQSYATKPLKARKTILWWNEPYWMRRGNINSGYCNMSLCEYPNCVLTTHKSLFNVSNAVIFSIVGGGNSPKVPISRSNRNPDQAWVFFTAESPAVALNHLFEEARWHNVFNWSMTYRRDADVFRPYGLLELRNLLPTKNYTEIFNKKTKQVAWLVSHCVTHGKRELYVKELKKYIDVDVYGRCGPGKTKSPDKVLDTISSDYKFYLGFENSLCKDYVTEKFFKYYQYDVINVVRGLADYDESLPNGTFINSAHFNTIKALGEHLIQLGNDERGYISYLKEKDRYTAFQTRDMYCEALCHLCEKLNNLETNKNTYGNIFSWLGKCHIPNNF